MNLRKLSLAVVALTFLALPAFSATNPMKPGNWQITMEMDAPGMPMKMPPMTINHCVTKEDVEKDPDAWLPKGRQGNSCKISDYKIDGNKVTWSVKCEGKEPVTGNGEITFEGDGYKGWSKMHAHDMDMTMKWDAKRTGDCK